MSDQPTILTIAGSDPSGGAGIQADLKTIEAHRGFGTSVITALTAQNTLGVQGVWEMSVEAVSKQLTCLVDDLPPKAIKTGMLASSPIIQALIQALSEKYSIPIRNSSSTSASIPQTNSTHLPPLPPLIVDPVSVSTSRHSLLSPSAINDLVFDFLPLCYIVTPNALEAEMIVNCLRARSGSSSTTSTSTSGSTPKSNAASALSEEVLGKAIKDTEDDTGVKVEDLKSMIEVGTEILAFLQSETRGGVNAEKGVLVKGGHVPLTTPAFKEQLRALREEEVGPGLEVEVVWNGNTLEADSEEEEEDGEFVEILSAYRQTLVKAKQGELTSTQPESNSLDTDIATKPPSEPAVEVEVKEDECIVDVLLSSAKNKEGVQATLFVAPSIRSRSTHGTGCTLSAAIASNVGHGKSMKEAVQQGIEYVQYALITAEAKGQGNGPLNHQCMTIPRPLPLPTLQNPHPFMSFLLRSSPDEWKGYVRHPFVLQLGKGTLPVECFRHYIIQDWHYLRHYARAHALAASKTSDFEEIKAFSEISLHIARESTMHVEFCKSFGISMEEMLASTESPANFSYSQYILDVGHRGDVLELVVAVLSCLVGYGEVGLYLRRKIAEGSEGFILEGNRYRRWIEDYSGADYQGAVTRGIESLEQRIVKEQPSPARLERLVRIWRDCVRLETNFWQMGLDLS